MVGSELSSDDWAQKALSELRAAQVLGNAGLWQQSFQHAGFAIECALKARIMNLEGLNRWPDRADRPALYSHDLARLAEIAGLHDLLKVQIETRTRLGLSWLVAKDWRNDVRYDPRPFSTPRGRDMLEAIDAGGLVIWILDPR